MPTTDLGYHYPAGTVSADGPGAVEALAADVDASPGVSSLAGSLIDALTGTLKRAGRMIWNSSSGVLEVSDGGSWKVVPVVSDDAPAAVTAGSAAVGTAVTAARADHVHTLCAHDHSTTAKGGAIPKASVTDLPGDLSALAAVDVLAGAALGNGVAGTPTGTQLKVTKTSGSNVSATLSVAAGSAVIDGHWATSGAPVTLTVAAPNSNDKRLDLIVMRRDPDTGATAPVVVLGTPAVQVIPFPDPTYPALGSHDVRLAAMATSTVGMDRIWTLTDAREFLPAGTSLDMVSKLLPTNARPGQRAYDDETGMEYIWDGTAWDTPVISQAQVSDLVSDLAAIRAILTGAGTYTPYTTTWTASGTACAIGNGTMTAAYTLLGDRVGIQIAMTLGSTSNMGTGIYSWSVPFAASGPAVLHGYVTDASSGANHPIVTGGAGTLFSCLLTASGAFVAQTAPMTWAAGDSIVITGEYRKA